MAILDSFQTSFEYGELSERLISRIDLPAYRKGLKTQENSYTYLHGGATKRRGTLFLGEVRDSSEAGRLIPYTYDPQTVFMLVLNGGKIEFLKNGGFVESSPGVRYALTIPYSEAELPEVKYTQPGNTMFFVHPAHPPKQLARITDTNWTLTDIPLIYNAVSDVTFANAFVTFKIINGATPFVVGQSFQITTTAGAISAITGPTAGAGDGQIAAVASMSGSTTSETWTITCTFASAARQEWSVVGSVSGAAKAYWKSGNYPQSIAVFEQRLFFGGSPQFPQHIWGSAAGDFLNLTVGNRESDAVIVQIAGNDYNSITHMVGARQLQPLTSSTEFSFSGPNTSAISGIAANIIKDHTKHGSNHVRPLRIGRETVFLQRDGKKARAISYSVTEDANVAPDITIFAEHLSRAGTFKDMAFAASPDYIAWVVRSDGQLLSLTLAREFETTAWARHVTDGSFESVATVPGDGVDDVYVIVQREVNGDTKRYVEVFDYTDTDICYSDCSTVYDGAPATVITGLSYLIGKAVTAIADGVVHPDMTVSDTGTIELQQAASYVIIGLPFTTTIEMLNPEFGDATASSQGKKISVTDIIVRFQDTVTAQINDHDIPFRTNTGGLDSVIEPFTGDKSVKSLGWRSPNNIKITSSAPTPLTVLGVIVRAAVN
ncbi:MAG: hypothetical protein V4757_06665 [Pseudomonadota bacterium]